MDATQDEVQEPERLTALDVRLFLARHDKTMATMARLTQRSKVHMGEIIHGRRPISAGLDARLRAAMAEIERAG